MQTIIGDVQIGQPTGHQRAPSGHPTGTGSEIAHLIRGVLAAGNLKTLRIIHLGIMFGPRTQMKLLRKRVLNGTLTKRAHNSAW